MNQAPNFDRILWLTPREFEVFTALGEGLSGPQIADLPGKKISIKSVHTYMDRIRVKLQLSDHRQLTCLAAKYNLIGLQRERNLVRGAPYKFVEQTTKIIPIHAVA